MVYTVHICSASSPVTLIDFGTNDKNHSLSWSEEDYLEFQAP